MIERTVSRRAKVGVFLEENLLNSARKSDVWPVFQTILEVAGQIGDVVHASAHLSYSPIRGVGLTTRRVVGALQGAGYFVDLKPRGLVAKTEKSRVDPDLAFSIGCKVTEHNLSCVVLGSGDSDYVNIVSSLREKGVHTLVICPNATQTSKELILSAATHIRLDELVLDFQAA